MPKDVTQRIVKKIEGGDNLVDEERGDTEPQEKAGIEHTGFNIIRLIKDHITNDEPIVFKVVHIYAHLPPRGRLNRFIFWIFAFIAQMLDMLIYFAFALIMLMMVLIIVLAITHGIGIDTYILNFIKELKAV
jgi:hypothetical protein